MHYNMYMYVILSHIVLHIHIHVLHNVTVLVSYYREWMDSQPGLISSVVYTYLSLLPLHAGPSLANLREQETQMTISLIRTRVLQLEFNSFTQTLSLSLSLSLFLRLLQ